VNVPVQGVSIRIEKDFAEEDTYGAKIKGPRAVPKHEALKFGAKKRRGKRTDAKADGFSRMGVSGSHEWIFKGKIGACALLCVVEHEARRLLRSDAERRLVLVVDFVNVSARQGGWHEEIGRW
jgi:hypothetical protein